MVNVVWATANLGFVIKLNPDGTEILYDTVFSEEDDTQVRHRSRCAGTGARPFHELLGRLSFVGRQLQPGGLGPGYFGYSFCPLFLCQRHGDGGSTATFLPWAGSIPDNESYATYLLRTDVSSGAVFETLLDDSGLIDLVDVAGGPRWELGRGGRDLELDACSAVIIARFGPEEEIFPRTLDLERGGFTTSR